MSDFYERQGRQLAQNVKNVESGLIKPMISTAELGVIKWAREFLFVGSGPSANGYDWDSVSPTACVVCVSTALPFLLEKGVKPNIVFCHDSAEETFDVVAGVSKYLEKTNCVIATPVTAYPELFTWSGLKGVMKTIYVPVYPVFSHSDLEGSSFGQFAGAVSSEMFYMDVFCVAALGDTCSTMIKACLEWNYQAGRAVKVTTVGCDYGWRKGSAQRVPIYEYKKGGFVEVGGARPRYEGKDVFELGQGICTTKLLDAYKQRYDSVKFFIKGMFKEDLVWQEESLRG